MQAVPNVGSRANADQLLHRMVRDNEIVRVGRGRYGPLRPRARPPVAPPPIPEPEAPAAPKGHGHKLSGHQEPKPAPRIPADPGVPLRDELARELIERRLDIREDQPVEAPRIEFSFDAFFATISAMYVKHGLCPPFRLRDFARSWINDGIAPPHCLDVVDGHLREHAPGRRSGSLDGLLPYLDKLIRGNGAPQPRRQEPRSRNSIGDYTTRSRAPRIIDARAGSTAEADWEGDY